MMIGKTGGWIEVTILHDDEDNEDGDDTDNGNEDGKVRFPL